MLSLLLSALVLLTTSVALSQPREFRRCPDGYRFYRGVCHTFGYRDHALRYHRGHFFRHQQPIIRVPNPHTGVQLDGYPSAKGGG